MPQSPARKAAQKLLQHIAEQIESIDRSDIEIETSADHVQCDITGLGTYLIHYQSVKEELWLSSPRLGAFHFHYDPTQTAWLDTRNINASLLKTLNDDLGHVLSHTF